MTRKGRHRNIVWRQLASFRQICLLLAFVVAVLGTSPCGDASDNIQVRGTEQSKSSKHEHSRQRIDFCSPFCSCVCCSSEIGEPPHYILGSTGSNSNWFPSLTPNSIHGDNFRRIWQPPRQA